VRATYLDRDGTERDHAEPSGHDPLCDGRGWLVTGTEDRPAPCLDCRPHLRRPSLPALANASRA